MRRPLCEREINRRRFLGVTAASLAGAGLSWPVRLQGASPGTWDPDRPLAVGGEKLKVQPVLMYTLFERREKTSWKFWSDIHTREAAGQEAERISKELAALAAGADFPLDLRPLVSVSSIPEAR